MTSLRSNLAANKCLGKIYSDYLSDRLLEEMFAKDSATDQTEEMNSAKIHARLAKLGFKASLSSLFAGLM